MKRLSCLLLLSLIFGCNTATKKDASSPEVEENTVVQGSEVRAKPKVTGNSTYLCKINGENWAYTKASGIVTRHAKTKTHTAIMTFIKKLDKGSESIQLTYDADTFELISTSIQLRFKNKDGKPFTCYYDLFPDTKKRSPNSSIVGSIDLSNPTAASGTSEIANINIKYEKEALLEPENASISLTELKFKGVGYSDVDKLSNTFK